MGLFEDIVGAVQGVPSTVENWAGDVGHALTNGPKAGSLSDSLGNILKGVPSDLSWDATKLGLTGGGTPDTPPAPSTKPKSTGAGMTSQADSIPLSQIKTGPGSAQPGSQNPTQAANSQQNIANQAMDSLISEYQSALGAVTPYESGQVGQQASGQASQMGQAIAAGGQAAQNAFAANTATQNADYQNMAAADTQGSAGVTSALGNLKSADNAALAVSPYAGLLTGLTSGAQYRAETQPASGATSFGNTMPQWLSDAYSQAVGNYALSASGATTPGTGTSAGATNATNPSTTTSGPTGGP